MVDSNSTGSGLPYETTQAENCSCYLSEGVVTGMMFNPDSLKVEFYCISVKNDSPHYGIKFGGSYNNTVCRISGGKITYADFYGLIYND